MSENTDLDSNNLCIPEDAFDQFQAISMYQEQEYIALTEIGPPKPKDPDPSELSHLSYDNEVVVTTENEVNSTVNDTTEDIESSEQQISGNSYLDTSVSLDNGQTVLDQDQGVIPQNVRGRGRKTKLKINNDQNIVPNNAEIISSNLNSYDVQGNIQQESPVVNSTVVPRKRGRKPKPKPVTPMEVPSQIPTMTQDHEVSDISATPFSSDPENSDAVITVKRKRGRPRKTPLPNDRDKEHSSELSSSDNNIPNKLEIRRKRGRPRKISLETNFDSQIIPQFENTGQPNSNPTNDLKTEDLNEVELNKTYPANECHTKVDDQLELEQIKKEPSEPDNKSTPDLDNKILNDISFSENDDLDDISLSKLKQLPDTSKSVDENHSNENNKVHDSINIISENINVNPPSDQVKKKQKVKKERRGKSKILSIESLENSDPIIESTTANDIIDDDDGDNLTLSKLKDMKMEPSNTEIKNITDTTEVTTTEVPVVASENIINEVNGTPPKRNTKMPIMSDFEYNIDSVLGNEATVNEDNAENSLLVEDTSKRPVRRKVQTLHYEEESDEDPFANVELSDDDAPKRRKGNRYYSDDEYIPGRRGNKDIDSTDSEANELIDETIKQKKKKLRKRSDNHSPRKKGKIDDTAYNVDSDDVEVCLQSSLVRASDDSQQSQPSKVWGSSNEFENFLAKKIQGTNLKIKKVSSTEPTENKTLEIPTVDTGARRTIEMCSQTQMVNTVSTGVQTSTPYDIPMKENIVLTPEQSEKACYFLNSIVKTTSELGALMTQKSEDFIKKKINTTHVTDTMKMDYCVKKSFLLFKLAKHNLMQMEEDLAKQYEQFLNTNNLTTCREVQKQVVPSAKPVSSDSDCEIVEEPVKTPPKKFQDKPKFNPKTVFLNKELSIKIAKKPTENKKLDIKGRHTVWINDTVMVKKVKPTQSFLAQDSRNKKPPDNKITTEMVSNFFKNYYRQQALSICSPFITTDWLNVGKECVCNYFVVKPIQFNTTVNYSENDGISMNNTRSSANTSATNHDLNAVKSIAKNTTVRCPETLFKLCFWIVKNQMHDLNHDKEDCQCIQNEFVDRKEEPVTLFRLCLTVLSSKAGNITEKNSTLSKKVPTNDASQIITVLPLKMLCHQRIVALLSESSQKDFSKDQESDSKPRCSTEQLTDFFPTYTSDYISPQSNNRNGLCLRVSSGRAGNIMEKSPTLSEKVPTNDASQIKTVLSLKMLCHQRIVALLSDSSQKNFSKDQESVSKSRCSTEQLTDFFPTCTLNYISRKSNIRNGIKSLLSVCVEFIQREQVHDHKISSMSILIPKLLKTIAFENVKQLLYGDLRNYLFETSQLNLNQHSDGIMIEGLTINSINTLSEEAFLNLEQSNADIPDSPHEYLDDFDNDDHFEHNFNEPQDDPSETSWVTQVQMKELRSCVTITNPEVNQGESVSIITQIKLEPLDDVSENMSEKESPAHVKAEPEPAPGLDEMTLIPDIIKPEVVEHLGADPIQRQDSNSYDVDTFEQFVATNKIMHELNDDIFSQSVLRVRRQHEPDYEEENDTSMSLLVPQTYEPLTIETAKGHLMESSSDDDSSKTKKVTGKKKPDKRKGKQKKPDLKANNKDVSATLSKEKVTINEVATLTRRMKDKIRQEEKKNDSTDSENEDLPLRLRNRKEQDKSKHTITNKSKDSEIQCNNVDSTDQVDDDVTNFTGFTAIDQNEISTYQKYMKYVYDKIIPDNEDKINSKKDITAPKQKEDNSVLEEPIINYDEPVELLECEPTMPFFDDTVCEKRFTRQSKGKAETLNKEEIFKKNEIEKKELSKKIEIEKKELSKKIEIQKKELSKKIESEKKEPSRREEIKNTGENSHQEKILNEDEISKREVSKECSTFIDRHGWQCYPVNPEDSKLYHNACIALEKLPESFVQIYFEYQGITRKDKIDEEIDRLTNLNSLNRTAAQLKDFKAKLKSKKDSKGDRTSEKSSEAGSRAESPTYSDHYDELEPSDEEGIRAEDEAAPHVAEKHTENTLAKSLLMHDNDSDNDEPAKIKPEPVDDTNEPNKNRPNTRNKKKETAIEDSSELMLTADKMMNKELSLLHAPIVLKDDVKETPSTGPVTRNKQKSALRSQPSGSKTKNEEDSSSEEEKQWVTTKEKLLKRLGKKEDTSLDDAKRAKLVSEFIERRGGLPDSHIRSRYKSRRSAKKFLERQKQLRVLSRELFGESADSTMSKRSQKAQASLLYKGRRNIRKVIDKKSLARSTVVANMEEFERKRRLNAKQTKLRELLGCEEGVNVLVINDEVCLEYDFEENRPVVTIHPFFTKVMKAHQYEGVKFMWDACFESLAEIESGHPGGGCILAHCMGLGKTLQVLALLHTVLTHPRVGMQRVLVCCPLSTVLNWVDEIHKWLGPVTNQIKVFELSKLKKTYERAYQLEDWYNGGGIFIIGYELFRSLTTLDPFLDDVRPTIINKIRTALLDPGPDIIVCDEGHLLKNDCSVLAVAMSRVVTKRRIVLTGTPMQNNLREYYCMVNFVKPNLLGTYAEYSNRFENPIMNGQHRDSREEDIKLMKARTHILHKVLEGCLQRQEASVLYPYLPKKHEYTLFITLTQCQWDLYKHYLNHYGNKSKQSILKDFHILQKIWSHPQVLHNFQTKARDRDEKNRLKEKLEDDLANEDQEEIKPNTTELWWLDYMDGGNMLETLDSSNKFVVVFRILDECVALGDKVLIFSTSLFCLDALEYFLKKINNWSLGQEYYRLDGSVPAEVRQKWCREFNADNNYKTRLFLVSTRAGCLGLNMTAANRVIIMDTSWNPAHDIQSIFRVYRFGQKKDCYIYRLVALGTMEQKIYERSVTKQAVACRVVDEQQIDRHYNMAELTELYKFDESGVSVAGGVAVGVHDVALLRVARHAAMHAVHEHDSLLRGSSEQGLPEHERNAAWMQFQQEQAHKQIENKLVVNIPSVPNISLKRLHGHDYALNPAPSPAVKTEDKSDDFAPNEPKAKKGKKNSVIKCCIPIQDSTVIAETTPAKQEVPAPRGRPRKDAARPGTSKEPMDSAVTPQPLDLNREEVMVEKITDILLKHNFQNKKGNTEISTLVMKVRNMVKKGYVTDEDMSDDLTASIARILLPQQMPLPKVTDIMCESINNSAAPGKKLNEDPEIIISDPTPKINNVFPRQTSKEPESRTKRKAAIAAEKSIDSIAQDIIINLDDDDDWDSRDTDFVPDVTEKNDKQNVVNTKGKKKAKTRNVSPLRNVDDDERTLSAEPPPQKNDTDEEYNNCNNRYTNVYTHKERNSNVNKTVSNEPTTSKISEPGNSTSILLSDDEEPVSSLLTPEKSTERRVEKRTEKHVERPPEKPVQIPPPKSLVQKPPDDDEVVPLPISLLKNQNFINIVAHTYLVGNPMLDEDAATLAAQYSTLKALKEAEQTGKDVCSGPIYDIAVKVIGKEVLKKMHSVNPKAACSSAIDAAASIQKKEQMIASEKRKDSTKNTKSNLRDDMIMEKLGMQKLVPEVQPSVTITASVNKVVPVGLIKTAAGISANESFGQPGVECILPDDENMIISDSHHAAPRMPPAPTPALSPAPGPGPPTHTDKPVILNHVLYKPKKQSHESYPVKVTVSTAAAAPTPTSQPIHPARIVLPTSSTRLAQPQPSVAPSSSVNTSTIAQPTVQAPMAAKPIFSTNYTICLDSDEEEPTNPQALPIVTSTSSANTLTLTPVQQQAPVPVSLTMANAPGIKLPLPSMPNLVPNTPTQPPQKLVLRQVPTANGMQPRFVLISSDQFPISTLPPVVEKPIQSSAPPQSPNTFHALPGESLLSLRNSDINKEVNAHRCNPGDILKISKLGTIEVINRSEMKGSVPPPATVDLTRFPISIPPLRAIAPKPTSASIDLTNVPTALAKPKPAPPQTTEANKRQKQVDARKARQISSSSSSSSSRASSPDNPLSILKDVVHIRAPDYPATSTESKKTKSVNKSVVLRTEKCNNSNISVQHIISSDSKNSDNNKSLPTGIVRLTKVPKSQVPKHVDTAVDKQIKKDALLKRIVPLINKIQPKVKDEAKPSGKKTINLDSLSSTTTKLLKCTVAGKSAVKKGDGSTIFKGTLVGGKASGKKPATVDLTNLMGPSTSILKPKTEVKKRTSADADTVTPKKKRTEPMTLKDFNLDDIDDIIELE